MSQQIGSDKVGSLRKREMREELLNENARTYRVSKQRTRPQYSVKREKSTVTLFDDASAQRKESDAYRQKSANRIKKMIQSCRDGKRENDVTQRQRETHIDDITQ